MAIRKPLRKKTATKRPGARKKTSKSAPKTTSAGIAKGASGFGKAHEQQERQQEEYERKKERPFPFRITQKDINEKKNTVDMLYLDEEPTFVRLHTVPNARGGFDDEVCLADTGEPCPLCQKLGKEGTWTLVLTALDKRPYRNRDGKLIKQSKKLVLVKSRNIDKFERQFKKHGTFRGLVCTHRRHGGKEASIGEDLEFKTKLVPESVIAKSGELSQVTDYDKAFAALDVDALESKYHSLGAGGNSGRGGYNRGSGGGSGNDDDAPAW